MIKTIIFAVLLCSTLLAQQPTGQKPNLWAFEAIDIPKAKKVLPAQKKPVVVAVIDDGFRLSHESIRDFIYKNPQEVAGNQLDDEGNYYIDDISGWDLSDNDNDVSVPSGREKLFFHGTYIASIITKVVSLHYGEIAPKLVQIMPVKVLGDGAQNTSIKDGYKGIKYAIDNGAQVICLAWNGGNPSREELKILREAQQKGILVVSSAGNFNQKQIGYPARAPEVLAVSGINKNFQKEKNASYSMLNDISAPAEEVYGAHPLTDNAYIYDNGTSQATALVAASAAILLSYNHKLSLEDVKEALLNTTIPFNSTFHKYGGTMGSGLLNLKNAIDYIQNKTKQAQYFSPLRPKGTIAFNAQNANQDLEVKPVGAYDGFYLEPTAHQVKRPQNSSFDILLKDTVWNSYSLAKMPSKLFVPSSSFKLRMSKNGLRKKDAFKIKYSGRTIDSTTLYCSETKYLSSEKGVLEDGSGDQNYANHSSCRWIISVPPGKRIKFSFDKMDTQGNVDFVYLVDGKTAIPENFIGKFSGPNIPPVVYSRTNEVLVWFVTDGDSTAKGWKLHYELVK